MKSLSKVLPLVPGLLLGCDGTSSPPREQRYAVVDDWPALDGLELGQVSGVGVDSNDDVLVFRRAARTWDGGPVLDDPIDDPTVLQIDSVDGRILVSMAPNTFVMPHGLTVDANDNLWVTDVGVHQVFKLSSTGDELLVLGERGVSGDDEGHFDRPTDVAIGGDGSVYVSDGYGNSRVVKFSAEGTFLLEWGTFGSNPGEFNVPHGIAIDALGRICVADRGNARVQIFDDMGGYLDTWEGEDYGRPWSLAFDPTGDAFIVDGGDQVAVPPDRSRIVRTDGEGQIRETFGSYGHDPGQFVWPHDIAADSHGSVYVVEVSTGMRIQKFTPM